MREFILSSRSRKLNVFTRLWLRVLEFVFCRKAHDWRTVKWRGEIVYGRCTRCGRRGRAAAVKPTALCCRPRPRPLV